jgi:hypothetical protein
MHIFVKTVTTRICVEFEDQDTIQCADGRISSSWALPPRQQYLIFACKRLEDDITLADSTSKWSLPFIFVHNIRGGAVYFCV